MKAKTEFDRHYIRVIHWVYKRGAEPELEETLEKQIQSLLDYAQVCISDPELAERVVRNALVQFASDEAVEVLANEDPGNPADYEMGPSDWARYEEPTMAKKKNTPETENTAPETAPAPAAPKAPRVSKFDSQTFTVTAKANWRRPGSHGYNTIQKLIDAGGTMTGADLRAAGGRTNDIGWDLDRNPDFLKATEAGGTPPEAFTVDLPVKEAPAPKEPKAKKEKAPKADETAPAGDETAPEGDGSEAPEGTGQEPETTE